MEIEKVIGSGDMGFGKVSRISLIAALTGFATASFIFGLWILGILILIPTALTLSVIPVDIDDSSGNKKLYLRMAEAFDPRLKEWNRYETLYEKEKNAIYKNMVDKIDNKSLSKAFYGNKEYSVVVKETKKDSLGNREEYRLKFKGNRWSLVHVEIKSEIEVWRQARISALKIK